MLNILHVSGPKTWGGGENQVFNTYKAINNLYSDKINQFLLTPKGSILAKKLEGDHVFTAPKLINLDLRFVYKIVSICQKEKIDIIHVHDPDAHSLSIIAADLFKNRAKIILHKKTIFPIKNRKSSIYKYNHPNIKKIIGVSKASIESIIDKIEDKSKLTYIYDGININSSTDSLNNNPFKNKLNGETPSIVIGNIANHYRHKNLHLFIDIAEQIIKTDRSILFVQIGAGSLTESLKNYTKQKNIEDNILFLGFKENAENYLPFFDIYLFTSSMEGFNVSILEAYKYGIPIVSSAVGGIKESIIDQKTGYLCDPNNINDFKTALLNLIASPELRKNMGEKGHERLISHFTLETMATKLINLYKTI